MKFVKLILLVVAFGLMFCSVKTANAQCAMCSTMAVGIAGYIWYKKYRRKNVDLQIRNEKLHLN
jgi:hypothetical protein